MKNKISRRQWLKASTGGALTVFSGCTESPEGSDQNSEPGGEQTTSNSTEALRDERLRTHTRWPHKFEAGDVLHVTIDVDESGPAGFVIFHDDERENGGSWTVELEDEIEYEIELDGLYQLIVDPNGVVDVVIEVERGS